MRELSLFSGAGGGLLGTHWLLGWECVGYVEWDEYCCKVLEQRIKDGLLPRAPIYQMDIRDFNRRFAERYRGVADVVTGGFPCQPFSVAGKQAGADDERNMWPATIECIRLVGPRYALLENVPGLLSCGYVGTVLGELAEAGYSARWTLLGADDIGAVHRRKRLWILADAMGHLWRASGDEGRTAPDWCGADVADAPLDGREPRRTGDSTEDAERREPDRSGIGEDMADAIREGLEVQQRQPGDDGEERTAAERTGDGRGWWSTEPDVGRVADGVAARVDRLRALGNGQVPAVVAAAWRMLGGE